MLLLKLFTIKLPFSNEECWFEIEDPLQIACDKISWDEEAATMAGDAVNSEAEMLDLYGFEGVDLDSEKELLLWICP